MVKNCARESNRECVGIAGVEILRGQIEALRDEVRKDRKDQKGRTRATRKIIKSAFVT